MFIPLRFALYIAMISLAIYVMYPLAVFVSDIVSNPECVRVRIENTEYINETHIRGDLIIDYCSSITLGDIRVDIGGFTIFFDQLTKGRNTSEIILHADELEIKSMEFTIAGIYRVKLVMVK
ncbi:MAG: hypothetical protein QXE81_02705 [Desulfurococcaceae archaeon]